MENLKKVWTVLVHGLSMLVMILAYFILFSIVFIHINPPKEDVNIEKPTITISKYYQQTEFNSQVSRWGCAFMVDALAIGLSKSQIDEYIDKTFGPDWYNSPNDCYMSAENHTAILGQPPLEAEEEILYEGGAKDKAKLADFMMNWADGSYRLSVDMGNGARHYWLLKKQGLNFKFYNPDETITKKEFIGYRRLL